MEPKTTSTEQMTTLSESVNHAVKKGFNEHFKFSSIGLTTEPEGKYYSPKDVRIVNFYRFEGYSDPQDNAILYLLETSDHKKGVLIDAYGTYADDKLSNFIREVEEIHKK
jgi:hypothetical protein